MPAERMHRSPHLGHRSCAMNAKGVLEGALDDELERDATNGDCAKKVQVPVRDGVLKQFCYLCLPWETGSGVDLVGGA